MSAAKQISWSAISSFISALLDIAKISVMARFIAPESFGTFAIAMVVMGFCQLFSEGGVGNALVSKKNITKRQAGHILNFNLVISLCIYALVLLFLPLINHFYHLPDLSSVILLLMVSLPFAGASRIFQAMLQRELRIIPIAKITLIAKVASLTTALIAVYFNAHIYALPISVIVYSGVTCLLSFIAARQLICFVRTIKWFYIQPILRFSIFQLGEFILNFFAKNLDILLITKFYSAEMAGIYSVSKNLLMRVGDILIMTFTRYFHPTLAKLQNLPVQLNEQYLCFFRITSTFCITAYLVVALNSHLMVATLLGAKFSQATVIFPYLCVWFAIRFCTAPVATLWLVKQLPQIGFIWNIVIAILVPTVILLTYQQGIEILLSSLISLQLVLLLTAIWLTYYLLKPVVTAYIVQFIHLGKLILFSLSPIMLIQFFTLSTIIRILMSVVLIILMTLYLLRHKNLYLGHKL